MANTPVTCKSVVDDTSSNSVSELSKSTALKDICLPGPSGYWPGKPNGFVKSFFDSEWTTENHLDELWDSDSVTEKSDGIGILEKHKKRMMFISHTEISECDPEFRNEITISRANLYKECLATIGYPVFM